MEIIDFPLRTEGKEQPERILKAALKWEGVQDVIVIANVNGEVCVAGSQYELMEILGLIELGKHHLLIQCEEQE